MLWASIEKTMHYIWSYYDSLPDNAKNMDIAILYHWWSASWSTYIFDWWHWIPLLPLWSQNPGIPDSLTWRWEKYTRRPSIEEVDSCASNMIENFCLENKWDNEVLHCNCDDVLRIVLESLWLTKTLKAYEEASKDFWYA